MTKIPLYIFVKWLFKSEDVSIDIKYSFTPARLMIKILFVVWSDSIVGVIHIWDRKDGKFVLLFQSIFLK